MFLFDTGPLLCFAAVPNGPQILADRYHDTAAVITDIDGELRGLCNNEVPPVAKAAKHAVGAYGWIERITIDEELLLERAVELQYRLQSFKRRPRAVTANSRADWGECITLAHAETVVSQGVVRIVTNEDAARGLSAALGVPAVCVVDVLRAMVRDGQLTKQQAFKMCVAMRKATLDIGDVVNSPNDF